MKIHTNPTLTLFAFVIFSLCLIISCKNNSPEGELGSGYGDALADASPVATCSPSWFPHSQTPPPAEGKGSPFDTASTTNNLFHEWSYQKFLWLTRPQNGQTLFESEFQQVTAQMTKVTSPISGVNLVLTDTGQAGSSGVLISNPAYSDSGSSKDSVYYAIYINDVLLSARDSFYNIITKNTNQVNNHFTFPVGSVELKTSWIKTSAIPAAALSSYYTTSAVILGKKETVAMLGMHVVGVVINHPEFIWATFEHKDMAPLYDWTTTIDKDVPVTSSDQKLFFAKGYQAGYNDVVYHQNGGPQNVFTVFQYGVPRTTQNNFMATSQSEDGNYNNIVSINTCVAGSLKDVWNNYFYNGSTWSNMDGLSAAAQADTIYNLGGQIGVTTPNHILRGSSACFNITMETFTQVDTTIYTTTASQLTNCFSCHSGHSSHISINGQQFDGSSPLYLSHIFRSYLGVTSGTPVSEIKKHRLLEFMAVKQAKSK